MIGIVAGLKGLVEVFKAAGIIKDRGQEAAIQAQFLSTTSGPLYQVYRVTVMFAAAWDFFLNSAAIASATADNVGLPRAVLALIELAVALWPFSERIFDSVPGAIAKGFAHAFTAKLPTGRPENRPAAGGISATTDPAPAEVPGYPPPFSSATGFRKAPPER